MQFLLQHFPNLRGGSGGETKDPVWERSLIASASAVWYQSAKNWILERQSVTKMQLHESAGESLREMPGYSLVSSFGVASCGKGRVWDAHGQWTEARS